MKKTRNLVSVVLALTMVIGLCSSVCVASELPAAQICQSRQECFDELSKSGFETERLICERTTVEDLPILGELISENSVNKWLLATKPNGFKNKEESMDFVTRDLNRTDEYYLFTVKLKDSKLPIGQIGYTLSNQSMYVYYWLGIDYHGYGYASEVFLPLTKHIFQSCEDVKCLCINCDYNNNESFRLAKKICEQTNASSEYNYSINMYKHSYRTKDARIIHTLEWSFYLKKAPSFKFA